MISKMTFQKKIQKLEKIKKINIIKKIYNVMCNNKD